MSTEVCRFRFQNAPGCPKRTTTAIRYLILPPKFESFSLFTFTDIIRFLVEIVYWQLLFGPFYFVSPISFFLAPNLNKDIRLSA